MKVHHLKCSCMCPAGAKLLPQVFPKKVICHCLLIETKNKLLVVDSGFSQAMLENPRLMGPTSYFLGVQTEPENSILYQIKNKGLNPEDVTDVVLTHLDSDHASGAVDFKKARVHTSLQELEAATNPVGYVEKTRYRSFSKHTDNWQNYDLNKKLGEAWFGFDGVQSVEGTDDEVLLVPLFGHNRGHMGVAVKTNNKWLLHAGDAYYNHLELKYENKLLRMFQRIVHWNLQLALNNQLKLAELQKNNQNEVAVFCAHDEYEFNKLAR